MKDELIKMLPDIKQAIASGVAYGSDLFQRAVTYYTYQSYLFIGMWTLFLLISIVALICSVRWFKKGEKHYRDAEASVVIISSFFIMLFVICVIACLSDVIKLKTIPEVYMIEKIMYMSR